MTKSKYINELPMMEGTTENTNIVVEDNGETKRIPASVIVPENMATKEELAEVEGKIPTDTVTSLQLEEAINEVAENMPEGGVSPDEVTTIVKENFPGGVGYEGYVVMFDEEVTIPKEESYDDVTFYGWYDIPITILPNRQYTVTFDGVEYICDSMLINHYGQEYYIIGDPLLWKYPPATPPEIPFLIGGGGVIAKEGTYSIKVEGLGISPIQKEYLPFEVVNPSFAILTLTIDSSKADTNYVYASPLDASENKPMYIDTFVEMIPKNRAGDWLPFMIILQDIMGGNYYPSVGWNDSFTEIRIDNSLKPSIQTTYQIINPY